jgi:ribose 5-phosphate isomerase A
MASVEERKREVGRRAAELVEDGMIVGLGTGSTAKHLVDRLGERVREGLRMRGIPTSDRTAEQARALGIELTTLEECPEIDLAIDGADQIDPFGDLIKGLGGAHVREKRVARAARAFVVIADASKEVPRLGVGCPVPVEVRPDRIDGVSEALRALGAEPLLRLAGERPYRTDNGNPILDAHFDGLDDPRLVEGRLDAIAGVVGNGIFPGMTDRVLIADPDGVREWFPAARAARKSTGR